MSSVQDRWLCTVASVIAHSTYGGQAGFCSLSSADRRRRPSNCNNSWESVTQGSDVINMRINVVVYQNWATLDSRFLLSLKSCGSHCDGNHYKRTYSVSKNYGFVHYKFTRLGKIKNQLQQSAESQRIAAGLVKILNEILSLQFVIFLCFSSVFSTSRMSAAAAACTLPERTKLQN